MGKITKKAKQIPARNKIMLENKTPKNPILSSLYKPGAMKFHSSKSKYGIATNVATQKVSLKGVKKGDTTPVAIIEELAGKISVKGLAKIRKISFLKKIKTRKIRAIAPRLLKRAFLREFKCSR